MTTRARIRQLRFRFARGARKIARITGFNSRRRRAIKRLRAELGARMMFDSVEIDQIPARARAVAGYTAGNWPTYWDLVKAFPHAFVLAIAVAASHQATCLDIEQGDASIAEAPGWVRREHGRGIKRPWLYIQVSNADELVRAMEDAGIRRNEYILWTAHWTFEPHLCGPHSCGELQSTTAQATQFTDVALGRNLDQSLVAAGVID